MPTAAPLNQHKENAHDRTTELTPLLKRLKLGAVLNTLPERVALARRDQIDYASFLQIILTDEINRRDHRRLELRLQRAGFEQTCRLEDFDWSASITLDRVDAAFSLQFLDRNEHVLLVGPVGVGKSIAQAPDMLLSEPGTPSASYMPTTSSGPWLRRVDHSRTRPSAPSSPRTCSSSTTSASTGDPTAVHRPLRAGHRQASYRQLRHHLQQGCRRVARTLRDPILGNSALDRLANASYQIVIEGASYRERLSPHRALLDGLDAKEVVDPQTSG